jgi:DNA-binding NarL/FixJ family response regulator
MASRLLLADDHVVVREGLRALLEREGFSIVAEASTGREAVERARELQPEIAILDIGMPVLGGVPAARELRRAFPDMRLIALTVHSEEQYVLGALDAGFTGYVLKSQAAKHLVRAIHEVARGRVYVSPSVSPIVVAGYLGRNRPTSDPLTARELEVLQLVAEGRSTKEIGALLGISARTAESHRKRIGKKLRIRGTAGLVRYAIRRGVTEA